MLTSRFLQIDFHGHLVDQLVLHYVLNSSEYIQLYFHHSWHENDNLAITYIANIFLDLVQHNVLSCCLSYFLLLWVKTNLHTSPSIWDESQDGQYYSHIGSHKLEDLIFVFVISSKHEMASKIPLDSNVASIASYHLQQLLPSYLHFKNVPK